MLRNRALEIDIYMYIYIYITACVLWTDLEWPSAVDKAVGTLEVAVWAERGRVKVVHALRHVTHEAELERIVQLKTLILQHVLSAQHTRWVVT